MGASRAKALFRSWKLASCQYESSTQSCISPLRQVCCKPSYESSRTYCTFAADRFYSSPLKVAALKSAGTQATCSESLLLETCSEKLAERAFSENLHQELARRTCPEELAPQIAQRSLHREFARRTVGPPIFYCLMTVSKGLGQQWGPRPEHPQVGRARGSKRKRGRRVFVKLALPQKKKAFEKNTQGDDVQMPQKKVQPGRDSRLD